MVQDKTTQGETMTFYVGSHPIAQGLHVRAESTHGSGPHGTPPKEGEWVQTACTFTGTCYIPTHDPKAFIEDLQNLVERYCLGHGE